MRLMHEFEPRVVPAAPPSASDDLGLAQVVALLVSNRLVIAESVFVTMAIAVAYLLVVTPQYAATALLLIDTRTNSLNTLPTRATDANSESAYVETQVGVLNSERIARAVIAEQKLFDLPEFKAGSEGAAAPSEAPAAGASPGQGDRIFDTVPAAAVKEFRRRLAVKRSPATSIIEISFTFPDPERAAAIANGVSNAYIADQLKSREEAVITTSQWLRQRTVDLRRETQAAETALDEFRNSNPGVGSSRSALRDLESTAQSYRMVSESFQKQSLETAQQLYLLSPDARSVSKAWPPSEKSSPRRALILAVAMALGLATGFLIALVRGGAAREGPETKAA
jgi:uncharacterized protein involved in exopolysaccharide biosynthesis